MFAWDTTQHWGQLLECSALRSDAEGAGIVKKFVELAETSCSPKERKLFMRAFLTALSATFTKGWAVSARLLLESDLFIQSSRKRRILLQLACRNRNDGASLIYLLKEKGMIQQRDDDGGFNTVFALASRFGNGDTVAALVDVVCPEQRPSSNFSWPFGNQADPLGVLRARFGRKKRLGRALRAELEKGKGSARVNVGSTALH